MTFFIISTMLNAITAFLCCFFVLANNRGSKTVRSFSIFLILVSLWSFFYFLSMQPVSYDGALLCSRTLNSIAIFIPLAFLDFCIRITENKNIFIKKLLNTNLILSLLTIPFLPTNFFIKSMSSKMMFPYYPNVGPVFYFTTFQFILTITIAVLVLFHKFQSSHENDRKIFKLLTFSSAISFLGGGTNYFLCYDIPIAPYGNPLVLIIILVILYLIFKHSFLDIRIVFSRSVTYTIIIFAISLIYFMTTYFASTFLNQLIGYKSFLFSILCASITAFAFIPLKETLERYINKAFFKKSVHQIEEENTLLLKEVAQTDRLKTVAILASGMAHEIKNPLTALKTFSEYLPQKTKDEEFLKKFAPIISKEINRIDALVHELLQFAKPAPVELKSTPLLPTLDSTLDFLNNDLIKRNISLIKEFHTPPDLSLYLDYNQFKQALLNILLNSIDAMHNGGQLTITTQRSADQKSVFIKIHDTGSGIKSDDLKHIFDPFFSRKDNGTGLGLSITFEIIKNHGGKIFAESKPDHGTCFIIEMPYNSPLL